MKLSKVVPTGAFCYLLRYRQQETTEQSLMFVVVVVVVVSPALPYEKHYCTSKLYVLIYSVTSL